MVYFLPGKTYFTGDVGYQHFLAFIPMLNLLVLDNNKKSSLLKYHPKNVKHLMLILPQSWLI